MGTTTLLSLDQKLLETIGDWKQHPVTTAIAASASIVSTHLQQYRSTADYFNDSWVYIEDKANIDVVRRISDDDGTSTLTVLGANLLTDGANLATFRLSRYGSQTQRELALNQAINEVYPHLFLPITDTQLVTYNTLPTFRWSSSTAINLWQSTNATTAKSYTAGIYRGNTASAKVSVTAANGYILINSDSYPSLLDLQNKTVSAFVWAYPEVANDAAIVIYTKKADGTAQTLTSTTANPAGEFTLLKLENQTLNDDLVDVQIRLKVATDAKYVYFMPPRVSGWNVFDYLLPNDFDNGNISQVYVQTAGSADYPCDDIQPRSWERVFGYEVYQKDLAGTLFPFIKLPYLYGNTYQIKLVGDKPLESLSAATDSISLDGHKVNLLLEYAAHRLFKNLQSGVSSEDRSHYEIEAMKHLSEYYRLLRTQAMPRKSGSMKLQVY